MSYTQTFRTAYLKVHAAAGEDLFLSVTPRFELGPGIRRDGLTEPRMLDPHSLPYLWGVPLPPERERLPQTSDAFVQRAGTWTVFHHVQQFLRKHGDSYQIVGVQSCGDLTMNPWHVAFVQQGKTHLLCHLSAAIDGTLAEPYHDRIYRCLVKWKLLHQSTSRKPRPRYEFADLRFARVSQDRYSATLAGDNEHGDNRVIEATMPRDISNQIEFALSGKPIIQRRSEIPLANIIDRFQDVRHVYNVPSVSASGTFRGVPIKDLNFGEYWLRRLARVDQ